jgi:hypothetical protein
MALATTLHYSKASEEKQTDFLVINTAKEFMGAWKRNE